MIGVTVGIGDKHRRFAERAKQSVLKHTPLDEVKILEEFDRGVSIYYTTFYLFDMFDCEAIFYFDADICMVNDWDVTSYERFSAVRDISEHSLIQSASDRYDLDPEKYINAGMFIADRSKHKWIFDRAKEIAFGDEYEMDRLKDQTALNIVLQHNDVDVNYLPRKYNVMGPMVDGLDGFEVTDESVLLHGTPDVDQFEEYLRENFPNYAIE